MIALLFIFSRVRPLALLLGMAAVTFAGPVAFAFHAFNPDGTIHKWRFPG